MDTKPTTQTDAPDNSIAGDDALCRPCNVRRPTPRGSPEGQSETSDEPAAIPATVLRSSLGSRHPIRDAVERTADQFASVTHTVRRTIDETDTPTAFDSVGSVQGQLPALSKQSLSTTALDAAPVIASAAPCSPAAQHHRSSAGPVRYWRAGHQYQYATRTDFADDAHGLFRLVRRELERVFVNKTPALYLRLSYNIAANGVITGTPTPVDTDSTDFTYTATSPAEVTFFIDADGTFTFTPNENYDPNTGASFAVTISDASSDFHVHGLSGLLNLVTFGLIGESGHTHTEKVTVSGVVPRPDFQRTVSVRAYQPTDFRFLPRVTQQRSDRILIRREGRSDQGLRRHQMQEQPVITLPHDQLGTRDERYRGRPGLQ